MLSPIAMFISTRRKSSPIKPVAIQLGHTREFVAQENSANIMLTKLDKVLKWLHIDRDKISNAITHKLGVSLDKIHNLIRYIPE